MNSWFDVKDVLNNLSGLSRDALHVLFGVGAQFAIAALPRQSLARPWPWLIVLAGALLNERYDLDYETWPDVRIQHAESVKDVLVTMAVPTLLLLASRFAPGLFRPSPPAEKRLEARASDETLSP